VDFKNEFSGGLGKIFFVFFFGGGILFFFKAIKVGEF
jgi:hypothetical protein